MKVLVTFFVTIAAAAAQGQPWPVEFPNQLMNKTPVSFPLKSVENSAGLPGEFVRFVKYVRNHCKNNSTEETCLLPYVVTQLDAAGTRLRRSKVSDKSNFDMTTSLASASLDFDLSTLSQVPDDLTRYFVALRLLKIIIPKAVAETSKWKNEDLNFDPRSVRQFGPWITELSSFAALAKYKNDLVCEKTDQNCSKVKMQLEVLLQKAATLIANSEKIKLLTNEGAYSALLGQIPEIETLRVFEPLIDAHINLENKTLFPEGGTALQTLSALDALGISLAETDFFPIDFTKELVAQSMAKATSRIASCSQFEYYFGPCDQSNKARVSVLASKIAFIGIYSGQTPIINKNYFKKFINIKKLGDILATIKSHFKKCEYCDEPVSQNWQRNAIDIFIKEAYSARQGIEQLLLVETQNQQKGKLP